MGAAQDFEVGDRVLAFGRSPSDGWVEFQAVVQRVGRGEGAGRNAGSANSWRVKVRYTATKAGQRLGLLLPQPPCAVLDRADVRPMPAGGGGSGGGSGSGADGGPEAKPDTPPTGASVGKRKRR